MSQEVADKATKSLEDLKAAGGPTEHIEHITDREEAVKVRSHNHVTFGTHCLTRPTTSAQGLKALSQFSPGTPRLFTHGNL